MHNTDNTLKPQATNNNPDHFTFIIGAMKSGTTSLFEILNQHPSICPSKIKEPDYFTEERDENAKQDYLSLWNWQKKTHETALESSVAYTKFPFIKGVPQRMYHSNLGQYRFIYMLRNPLTRIESQVRHGLFAGWGKSLDTGVPEDAINFSSYAMQLDKYMEFFPIDNIMLVTLDEFKNNPHEVLSNICLFLGIDNKFKFSDVNTTRNSGDFFNTSVNISRITQSGFGQYIVRKILSPKIKSQLRHLIARSSKGKGEKPNTGRWKLTPEENHLVLDRLESDLKRLEKDYKVDIKKYWDITI